MFQDRPDQDTFNFFVNIFDTEFKFKRKSKFIYK